MYKIKTKLNYFYIFLVLIWAPLQTIILKFDGRGRVVTFLTILVLIVNFFSDNKFRKILFSVPVIFWGLWVVYSVINSLFIGIYSADTLFVVFIMNIIKPFVVMVIVYYEFSKNSSGLIKLLTICLGLYTLMGLTVVGFDINNEGRLSSVELGNQLPLNIVFLIFFVCLRFSGKEINFTKTILLVVFSLLIISLSGTRKAFGAGMLIIVSTLISYINFKSVKTIIAVLLCVILLFFGYKYMMDNTVMGDRMAESSEVGEKYNTSNIKALNMLGDRTYFYILGWEIFKENPQTGIGLENYRAKTGSLYRIHSEYIVQLAECGIIGSILFLLFYLSIGSKLYKHWRWYPQKRNITWVMIGGFVAIAFINFTAWTYSFPVYFAVFGVIISYIKQIINTSDENSNTR